MIKRSVICPSWWLCLISLVVLSILVSLGVWQLNRADEKRAVLEQKASQSEQSAMSVIPDQQSYSALRHRAVKVHGHFLPEKQFLLDNQIRHGKAGYSVITPFLVRDGRWVLVDRGWVAQGLSRQLLPDVSVSSEEIQLEGVIYTPYGEAYTLGGFSDGAFGWPLLIQYLDFTAMSQALNEDVFALTVRMAPESRPGYLREWVTVPMGPQKHIGYAVQWFAMAAAFLILLGIASRKRTEL